MQMGRLFQSNHLISELGFVGVWDAGSSSGQTSFTINILNGSGGEINTSNNTNSSVLHTHQNKLKKSLF